MSANQIVQINVSQTQAPTPNTLQKTGAFISQGGTTLASGTKVLVTDLADLTAILASPKTLTSLAWATGVVTAGTSAPHGWPTGATFKATIAGALPVAYNGTFTITVTGASSFTYPLASDPSTATAFGTVLNGSASELTAMGTTFFAQGSNLSVYVLELGAGSAVQGVTALTTYITGNPKTIYSYLVPASWAAEATYETMVRNYNSLTATTYFFTTSSLSTYSNFTALDKSVLQMVPAPSAPATEFSLAAAFWKTLSYNPGSTNQVTPLAFSYQYGVTPYPTVGNNALLNTLKAANVNTIGLGAEGGLSNTILFWGHVMDGRPFNYWYAVDWMQINLELDLANEVINGSNNSQAPLYYDQNGINRLQDRAAKTLGRAITYGLAIGGPVVKTTLSQSDFNLAVQAGDFAGQVVVNAIPFIQYSAQNPNDFKAGLYSGLSAVAIPARGFEQIVFNLNVTDFVA